MTADQPTLTDGERTALMQAAHEADLAGCSCQSVWAAVERIIAARVESLTADRNGWRETAGTLAVWMEEAQAERDALRGRLARVEALVDEWEAFPCGGTEPVRQLRAALAADADTDGGA